MTKAVFDNATGKFWAHSEDMVTPGDPRALLVEVPEDVVAWRLSYDIEANKLVIKYPGMTDSEAEAQQDIDLQQAAIEAAEKLAAIVAQNDAS